MEKDSFVMNRRTKAPCKDCTKRVLGCHSTCEEYIAYAEDNNNYNLKRYESNERYARELERRKGKNKKAVEYAKYHKIGIYADRKGVR